MLKKITIKLLHALITLIGITFLTFSLVHFAPGDPVSTMYLSSGVMPNEEIVEETRIAMGLHLPMHQQYLQWLGKVFQGDLGMSYSLDRPVTEAIGPRFYKSLQLTLSALAMTLLISFPLGVIAAVYQNKLPDYVVRFYSFCGISSPGFLVGTVLLYVFALRYAMFPVISIGDDFRSLFLPSCTLAFAMSCKYIRQIRSIVLGELAKEYVLGAKARGIPFLAILWRDVLPNTLPPIITLLGLSFGSLLSGVAVVEVIFSFPGIGSLAVNAISSYDYPLIQSYVLITSLIYMSVNLAVDLCYPLLDPRTRKSQGGATQ